MINHNDNLGSFRDPSGKVFIHNGDIFRSIFKEGVKDFEAARDNGIYDELMKAGYLIEHHEVNTKDIDAEGAVYCLSHPKLPFVSYPWEWCFSMHKDAALIHMEMMEMLLPHGFWLRDASAFNIQFDGKQLRFIDTLSVGAKKPNTPWVAYGQYCSHFLAPLAMSAYCDIRTLSLWRSYIDGIPLDLALKTLPITKRYRPGILMHLTMHAHAQNTADKKENIAKTNIKKPIKISNRGLLGIIRSLRKTTEKISWKRHSKVWESYGELRSYSPEDIHSKLNFVNQAITKINPKIVYDLGANTGEFSIAAASKGAFVVSIDSDPACTENLYQKIRSEKLDNILPLTMDLANPSPGLGWDGKERSSLSGRGSADLILALALIHHLVFTCCVPLPLIAEWFAGLGEHLLIEFVPTSDPMVKKLLVNRGEDHLPYGESVFKDCFERVFDFLAETELQNGRSLFLCKRRVNVEKV